MPLYHSQFSQKCSQKTLHSSPVRVRHGVSFLYQASDWYSASVPVIVYIIYYNIGSRYNGTRLYILSLAMQHITLSGITNLWIVTPDNIDKIRIYKQDIRYVIEKCNLRSCPDITKAKGPVTWWHVCQNWLLLAANENLSHSFTGTYVHRALQKCLRLKYHYILPVSTNNISGTRHKFSYSKLLFMMATLNG